MHMHPDIPGSDDIPYEKHVVAFLDVLGVRSRILQTKTLEEARDQILLFENATRHRGGYRREDDHEEVRIFSDNMCLAALPTHPGINWLLWRCIFIQGLLLEHGLLLRGGIALGGHYQSMNVIFSQGLLQSYLLESRVACWPRIVVTPEVVEEASKYGSLEGRPDGGTYPPPCDLLKQDSDGRWFLDYFRFSDHPEIGPTYLFAHHKTLVERGAREYANRPDIVDKYFWMGRFHNLSLGAYGQSGDAGISLATLFRFRRLKAAWYRVLRTVSQLQVGRRSAENL